MLILAALTVKPSANRSGFKRTGWLLALTALGSLPRVAAPSNEEPARQATADRHRQGRHWKERHHRGAGLIGSSGGQANLGLRDQRRRTGDSAAWHIAGGPGDLAAGRESLDGERPTASGDARVRFDEAAPGKHLQGCLREPLRPLFPSLHSLSSRIGDAREGPLPFGREAPRRERALRPVGAG